MDIDVRRAAPADVPGLVALSAALFAEDGAARDRLRNAAWPRDNGRAWIEGLLTAPDALVLVAAGMTAMPSGTSSGTSTVPPRCGLRPVPS